MVYSVGSPDCSGDRFYRSRSCHKARETARTSHHVLPDIAPRMPAVRRVPAAVLLRFAIWKVKQQNSFLGEPPLLLTYNFWLCKSRLPPTISRACVSFANRTAGHANSGGEYGYDAFYFRRILEAGAVDVLQADATRCARITGFHVTCNLCGSFPTPFFRPHCAFLTHPCRHTSRARRTHPCGPRGITTATPQDICALPTARRYNGGTEITWFDLAGRRMVGSEWLQQIVTLRAYAGATFPISNCINET
jgi:hypothetical protein